MLVAVALASTACVRQTVVGRASASPPPKQQPSVWERQIRNAKDAGEGDYQLRVLREKIASDAESIPARLELAKAYRERGYPDIALEVCRLAAARFPESGDLQLAIVRSLYELHRGQDAVAGLEKFLAAHPQQAPQYYSWMGILHDESGQWREGEAAHRKAIELNPADDSLHNNLGYNLLRQKNNPGAAVEFREALKLNPNSRMAKNNLGLALAGLDSTQEAIANWQQAGDRATAHNNLAAVLIEKGNYGAARKELEISLSYNRNLQAALRNLHLVSQLDGNPVTLSQQERTGWERWKTGVKRLFVGPLDEPRKATASPATGAEQ